MHGCDRPITWQGHRVALGPSWRIRLATTQPVQAPRLADVDEDPDVREVRHYLARVQRDGPAAAAAAFPLLAQAAELERDASRREDLVLMVIAGMTHTEMQERVNVPTPVIEVWERVFFEVRDCRGDLVLLQQLVVGRERVEFAARLHLAMTAGAEGVLALWDCDRPPIDEADRLVQLHVRLSRKFDVALHMRDDSARARASVLRLNQRLMLEQGQLELACRRLAEKCAERRGKDLAKRKRRELAARAAAEKAARARRRAEERQQERAARAAAREARRELATYQRRAEEIARAARVAESPLAQLGWGDTTGATAAEETNRTAGRGRRAGAPRRKPRPAGRKIPAEIGRDHRGVGDRAVARSGQRGETVIAPEETKPTS